jgi:hypothetical protein
MSFFSNLFRLADNEQVPTLKDIKKDLQIQRLTNTEQSRVIGGKRMTSEKSTGISEQTPQ